MRFDGGHIGRGSDVDPVLAHCDRCAAFRLRRVITKLRIVRMAGKEALPWSRRRRATVTESVRGFYPAK